MRQFAFWSFEGLSNPGVSPIEKQEANRYMYMLDFSIGITFTCAL